MFDVIATIPEREPYNGEFVPAIQISTDDRGFYYFCTGVIDTNGDFAPRKHIRKPDVDGILIAILKAKSYLKRRTRRRK